MPTKFYFHDATTSVAGTLPSSHQGPQVISVTADDANTNRVADENIGAGQTSVALTTTSDTTIRTNFFRRFVTNPLAAQTFATQSVTISIGARESNANSDMFESGSIEVYIWRPGSGSKVGNLWSGNPWLPTNEPGTTQTVCTATASPTSLFGGSGWSDGDIMCFEISGTQGQAMGTAYTNTIFYDGTTEGSITNIAAYIQFTNDVAYLAGGTTYTKAGFGKESA